MQLTEEQLERYSRQILADPFGGKGQRALAAARVRLWGASPCLHPAALYLARAGVRHLAIPAHLLETLDRSASPDTIWQRLEDTPGPPEADRWDVRLDACLDPESWHRQVRRQPPRLAAIWLGARPAVLWLALWARPAHEPCALDRQFHARFSAACPQANRSSDWLERNAAWCAGTLAAVLALRCLVAVEEDRPRSTWFVHDLARGEIWEHGATPVRHVSCALCGEET